MRMNRRNVLVGLGTIVAGGGAALGTGAFSSVEADRSVSVQMADDSNAYIQFRTDSTATSTLANQEYVSTESGTNGYSVVRFDFNETNGGSNGDGLNDDAVTSFDDILEIGNESGQEIEISYSADAGIRFYDSTNNNDINGTTISLGGEQVVGIEIDTRQNVTEGGTTVTFTATP